MDVVIVCGALAGVYAIDNRSFSVPSVAELFELHVRVVDILVVCGFLYICNRIFVILGFYQSHRLSRNNRSRRECLWATTLITVILIVFREQAQIDVAGNKALVLFWLFVFSSLMISREVAWWILQVLRRKGRNLRNVVIIGAGPGASVVAGRLESDMHFGYRVLRIIDHRKGA